jgi:hypothetical protein
MWSNGRIFNPEKKVGYEYWCKHYDLPSPHGLGGGKISKLTIRRLKDGKDLYNFDRGLDFDFLDESGKAVYDIILEKYN